MSTANVKTTSASDEALHLVRAAVASEIARLELALEMACKRLKPFEEKYGVTSQQFIAEMAAEDLDGGKEAQGAAVKIMYTYHYQDADGRLIFRYDNAQHRPTLGVDEYKHTPEGVVAASAPTLEDVLGEIVTTQMWA